MLKYVTALGLMFGPLNLFSAPQQLPQFINFGNKEFANSFYGHNFSPEYAKSCPFNCAAEMGTFFAYLKQEYGLRTVVETGTFKGNTTAFFGSAFDVVHTIEVNPDFYRPVIHSLQQFSNVHCHLGSSPTVMASLLPSLKKDRVLFYLDAHWYKDWPLLNELIEISKTHKNNCIIVIDDFKVPNRPDIPYDTHCDGHEYSFEYIRRDLNKVFGEYTIHYLIPKDVAARAKFVAIPKTWASQ